MRDLSRSVEQLVPRGAMASDLGQMGMPCRGFGCSLLSGLWKERKGVERGKVGEQGRKPQPPLLRRDLFQREVRVRVNLS